jgi:hypothetical protein
LLADVVVTLYLIEIEAGSKNPLLVVRSTCAILPGPKDEPLVGRAATRKFWVFSGSINSGSE